MDAEILKNEFSPCKGCPHWYSIEGRCVPNWFLVDGDTDFECPKDVRKPQQVKALE